MPSWLALLVDVVLSTGRAAQIPVALLAGQVARRPGGGSRGYAGCWQARRPGVGRPGGPVLVYVMAGANRPVVLCTHGQARCLHARRPSGQVLTSALVVHGLAL